MLALGKLRQEDNCEFKSSLSYIMSTRLAWPTKLVYLRKYKQKKQKPEKNNNNFPTSQLNQTTPNLLCIFYTLETIKRNMLLC